VDPVPDPLLLRKSGSAGSGLESREYGRREPSRCPRDILSPQKLALTSRTNGGPSVGIVRSLTQATEFFYEVFPAIVLSGYIICLSVCDLKLSNMAPNMRKE
jgi:hypothetical protein